MFEDDEDIPEMGNTRETAQKFINYRLPFERDLDFEIRGKDTNRREAVEYFGADEKHVDEELDRAEAVCQEVWADFQRDLDTRSDQFIEMVAEKVGLDYVSPIEEQVFRQLVKILVAKHPDDEELDELIEERIATMPTREELEELQRQMRRRQQEGRGDLEEDDFPF